MSLTTGAGKSFLLGLRVLYLYARGRFQVGLQLARGVEIRPSDTLCLHRTCRGNGRRLRILTSLSRLAIARRVPAVTTSLGGCQWIRTNANER